MIFTNATVWVVLFAADGNDGLTVPYSTADSRSEANEMANRLCREVPGAYAEVVSWEDAVALELVS